MIKPLIKYSLFFCLLLIASQSYCQDKAFSPKGSFSFDMGVPTKARNKAFGLAMEGLLNAGVDFRYNVFKGITVGVGLKYTFFTLNSFAFSNTAISGGYQAPGAYLVLGYEKFTTERISLTGSIRGGYSLLMSFNDSCKVAHQGAHINETFFVEPQIKISMLTDKSSEHAFSFDIGYSFYFHEFSNKDVCMNSIGSLSSESYEGITRYLSIGFGYRYFMGRR